MPKKVPTEKKNNEGDYRLALTPEARESQLIAAAERLAYKQIMEGTASSQLLVHYLKLGSSREAKEQELLAKKVELSQAKTKELESAAQMTETMNNALEALKGYRGVFDDEEYEDV